MNLDVMTKEVIVNNAISFSFGGIEKSLFGEENEIGMSCYRDVFDANILKWLEKMPKGWLQLDSCLRFNVKGYDLRFKVEKAMPVPYSSSCGRLGSVEDKDLIDRAKDFWDRKNKFQKDRESASRNLTAMIKNIRTLKKLEQSWPDGKPFYKSFIAIEKKGGQVAIRFDEINKQLGLA